MALTGAESHLWHRVVCPHLHMCLVLKVYLPDTLPNLGTKPTLQVLIVRCTLLINRNLGDLPGTVPNRLLQLTQGKPRKQRAQ